MDAGCGGGGVGRSFLKGYERITNYVGVDLGDNLNKVKRNNYLNTFVYKSLIEELRELSKLYIENEIEKNITKYSELDEFQLTSHGSLLENIDGSNIKKKIRLRWYGDYRYIKNPKFNRGVRPRPLRLGFSKTTNNLNKFLNL